MMNVLFIWDGDYPWDIRVEKVCTSLQNDAHKVHIVCRNLKREPLTDSYKGATIHRLPFLPQWLAFLNKAFSFPAFFSPLWLWRIFQVAKNKQCNCIIVRDLPMALAGLLVAKILGVPCVLDMAECYPEMLRCTWKFEGFSIKNFFIRNPVCADVVERIVMKHITHVWVMIEESRERLLRQGVPADKISIVSNTPVVDRFVESLDANKSDDMFHLIYVGLLNPSRGLDTVIKAVKRYVKLNKRFHFTIVGSGKAEERFKHMVKELELESYVTFLGWVDNAKVPDLVAKADVGIVPHHNCSHWANTIPNKLFDYMASGKPVIVSDVFPMKRIVESVECGLVYKDYDTNGLCDVFVKLANVDIRKNLSLNGKEAIKNKYNWAREEKIIFSSINNLSNISLVEQS